MLVQLEILGVQPGGGGMVGVPVVERGLLHRGAHRDGGAVGGRIDPDGIGLRPLRRDEAVEDHQAVIVGPVLFGPAVDGGDARRAASTGRQQFGLGGVDHHLERGLRGQFEFGVIVVGEASCGER